MPLCTSDYKVQKVFIVGKFEGTEQHIKHIQIQLVNFKESESVHQIAATLL